MEITSLRELAPCQEQIRLHKNHQVLPCQAGELWGKNGLPGPSCVKEIFNCASVGFLKFMDKWQFHLPLGKKNIEGQ